LLYIIFPPENRNLPILSGKEPDHDLLHDEPYG